MCSLTAVTICCLNTLKAEREKFPAAYKNVSLKRREIARSIYGWQRQESQKQLESNQGKLLRQRRLCINRMAKMSRRKPSGIKRWRVLNTSVIDTRPEIILLHPLRWLLCHHKNLSNPQLGCKEPKRHKNKNKNETEEKPKELQGRFPGNVSQDRKKLT